MKKFKIGVLSLAVLSFSSCSTGQKSASNDQIDQTIQSHKKEFYACFSTAQTGGKIVTKTEIDVTGIVTDAEIESTTMNQPKVEDCILKVMRDIRFPALGEGQGKAVVSYPFSFTPKPDAPSKTGSN